MAIVEWRLYDRKEISHAAPPIRGTIQIWVDLASDASSAKNFCVRFSDVIWRGNQW